MGYVQEGNNNIVLVCFDVVPAVATSRRPILRYAKGLLTGWSSFASPALEAFDDPHCATHAKQMNAEMKQRGKLTPSAATRWKA